MLESDKVKLIFFSSGPHVLADLLTFSRVSKKIKVVIYTVQESIVLQNKWYLDVWLLNDRRRHLIADASSSFGFDIPYLGMGDLR